MERNVSWKHVVSEAVGSETSVISSTAISCVEVSAGTSNILSEPRLSRYALSESSLKAEILWTLNVVMKHLSFNSCENNNKLFAATIPDSEIAQKYACGADKYAFYYVLVLLHILNKTLCNKCDNKNFSLFVLMRPWIM